MHCGDKATEPVSSLSRDHQRRAQKIQRPEPQIDASSKGHIKLGKSYMGESKAYSSLSGAPQPSAKRAAGQACLVRVRSTMVIAQILHIWAKLAAWAYQRWQLHSWSGQGCPQWLRWKRTYALSVQVLLLTAGQCAWQKRPASNSTPTLC